MKMKIVNVTQKPVGCGGTGVKQVEPTDHPVPWRAEVICLWVTPYGRSVGRRAQKVFGWRRSVDEAGMVENPVTSLVTLVAT
jgi:hypothetical protein